MTTEVQCTCGAQELGFGCKEDCLLEVAKMPVPPRRRKLERPPMEYTNLPTIAFQRNIPFGTFNPFEYAETGEIMKYIASGFDATLDNIRAVSTKYGERIIMEFREVEGIPGGKAQHWPNTALLAYYEAGEFKLDTRYTFILPPGDGRFHDIEVEEWL